VKLRVDIFKKFDWNKIDSVGLRKCPYYHNLTKKVMLVTNIYQSLPHIMAGKTAGIDMV